ncbi:maleylpyruvate isomerase N-terminal domain-containing protein [Streptomyces mayteni]
MSVTDGYLAAAERAVALLEAPEVVAAWERPSVLEGMTVGGLAAHLAYQIFDVGAVTQVLLDPELRESGLREAPITLLENYARAAWIDVPLDGEVNTGIRERAEGLGAQGSVSLAELARTTLATQRDGLGACAGDQAVFLPRAGWSLRLDDYLVTRLLELAVHLDDLAASVGLATPELPDAAFDPVLTLLARLAAKRHGQSALLRALARVERAPGAINAI